MSISINANADSQDVQRRLDAEAARSAAAERSAAAAGPQAADAPGVVSDVHILDENLRASASRLEDVDAAAAAVTATSRQIGDQPGSALAAQANLDPRNVLDLLKG